MVFQRAVALPSVTPILAARVTQKATITIAFCGSKMDCNPTQRRLGGTWSGSMQMLVAWSSTITDKADHIGTLMLAQDSAPRADAQHVMSITTQLERMNALRSVMVGSARATL